MFFFLRYKLTEKLIVVSEAGNAERRSINLYSLNSTIHLHLQYFSFLFFFCFSCSRRRRRLREFIVGEAGAPATQGRHRKY